MSLVVGRTGGGFPDKILRVSPAEFRPEVRRCGSICGTGIVEAVMSILTGANKVAVTFGAVVRRPGVRLPLGCDRRQGVA
jgi:hypothetical protein